MNTLQSLFAYKAWADNELFNALAEIPAGEHASAVQTATRILNHIHVVDRIFQAHLQGTPHGFKATVTDPIAPLEALQYAAAETDAWLERYASTVTPAQLGEKLGFRFTDGDSGTMTREEMLHHLIMHGSAHRGNVSQVLKSISIAPPRDLYTRFLHLHEPTRRQV